MEYAFGILATCVLVGALTSLWARSAVIGFAGCGLVLVSIAGLFVLLSVPWLALIELVLVLSAFVAWRRSLRVERSAKGSHEEITRVVEFEDPRLRQRAILWVFGLGLAASPVFYALVASVEHFAAFSVTDSVSDYVTDDGDGAGELADVEATTSLLADIFGERAFVLFLVLVVFVCAIGILGARHVWREATSISGGAVE
jgi:hypothetical protein